MTASYHYVKISNYTVCLHQSPLFLAWMLFFKNANLDSIFIPWRKCKQCNGAVDHIVNRWFFVKTNLRILGIFFLHRMKMYSANEVTSLPVFGHVCKQVHQGHKVFNFLSGTVTKIFDPNVSIQYIDNEVKQLQVVSNISFASSLKGNNYEKRYYEEEYISGEPVSDSAFRDTLPMMSFFEEQVAPCLLELFGTKENVRVSALDYSIKLCNEISGIVSGGTALERQVSDDILLLIGNVSIFLEQSECNQILNVFSHGDFCPANMVNTTQGLKMLDWENAGYRSALFDFYSYFFYRPVCMDVLINQLSKELGTALNVFMPSIEENYTAISEAIKKSMDVYRRIFYLELILRLAERSVTDNHLDMNSFLCRYLAAFSGYEELCGNNRNSAFLMIAKH